MGGTEGDEIKAWKKDFTKRRRGEKEKKKSVRQGKKTLWSENKPAQESGKNSRLERNTKEKKRFNNPLNRKSRWGP